MGALAVDSLGRLVLKADLADGPVAVRELDTVGKDRRVGYDLESAPVEKQAAVGAAEEDAVVVAVELQPVALAHRVGERGPGKLVNDLERVGGVTQRQKTLRFQFCRNYGHRAELLS